MDDTEDNATVNVSINVVAVNQCGQRGIATESTNGMVLPLRKCISNSSEVTLKISALLWVALLTLAAKRRRRVTAIVWRFLSVRPFVRPSVRPSVCPSVW